MTVVVDTNVPIVANGGAYGNECIRRCVARLMVIVAGERIAIDDGWRILREYLNNLRSSGQPGLGDRFLKWVLTNRSNSARVQITMITPTQRGQLSTFNEFPDDPDLAGFDASDHKFVAVALAHPDRPPILNAVDSDWSAVRASLARVGVVVEELCGDANRARIGGEPGGR